MKITIRRASFRAEDFNSENKCREFGFAYNIADFVSIDIEDNSLDAFKETLHAAYASLGAEYEMIHDQNRLAQLERKQMMINQIITRIFKSE